MKVSEAINKLEVCETVWVKGTVNEINYEGRYIRAENTKTSIYLDGDAEISLTEPKAEKVKVPDFVAEWYEEHKCDLDNSIRACVNSITQFHSREIDLNDFEKWFSVFNNEPIETLIRMKDGYTVKPKRWVVKNEEGYYFVTFSKYAKTPFEGVFSASVTDLVTFDDKSKAEAVAVLVEGSVEEV